MAALEKIRSKAVLLTVVIGSSTRAERSLAMAIPLPMWEVQKSTLWNSSIVMNWQVKKCKHAGNGRSMAPCCKARS